MFLLEDAKIPSISIDAYTFEKIKLYAKYATKRGIILCDSVNTADNDLFITEAQIPKQTVDYTKNKATHDEIAPYCCKNKADQYYGNVRCSIFIRTDLSTTLSKFTKEDFDYFMSLSDVDDFIIAGEITKNGELCMYYLDLSKRLIYSYLLENMTVPTSFANIDGKIKISLQEYISDSEIKQEIKNNFIEKTYSYGGYNYSNSTTTTTTTKTEVVYPKSELNKNNPDISKLV